MPRLVKRKPIVQNLTEDSSDEVDSLLQKQRLLLMSGKLPTLEPRAGATHDAQTESSGTINPKLSDEDCLEDKGTADVSKTAPNEVIDLASDDVEMSEVLEGSEVRRGTNPNRRRTLELGDQAACVRGFKRQASDGNHVGMEPARLGIRGGPVGARKTLSDRLFGIGNNLEYRESTEGRFSSRLEDKETNGSFTKMRIMALNESSSDESDLEVEMETSKEAQEAEAYTLYNKALDLQRAGNSKEAESTYQELLSIPLLAEIEPPDEIPELMYPGLMLKYSAYKNLASMSYEKKDLDTAIKYYVEAVKFDESDVTVWYRMGTIAVTLYQLPLAKLSFIQALKCSSKHWPSLDRLCTVLYAINDYASCLFYICKALEKDPNYAKGVVLREKMYQEQPSLRRDSYNLFRNCHDTLHFSQVKQVEADRIIKEALSIREKRRSLAKRPPMPLVKLLTPFPSFSSFTWKGLGERLAALYDHLQNSSPPLSICCKIDLSEFIQHPKEKEQELDSCKEDAQMDVTMETASPAKSQVTPGNSKDTSPAQQTPAKTQDTTFVESQTTPFIAPNQASSQRQDFITIPEDPSEQRLHGNIEETPGDSPMLIPMDTSQPAPLETTVQSPVQTQLPTTQPISQQTQQTSLQEQLATPLSTPQQTSEQTSQQISQQTPQETSQQTPQETSQQTPQETSQETPQETLQQTPPETSQETPQETSQDTPQETSQQTSQETSQQTPQETSQQTPQETSQQTPQETSQETPRETSQPTPQETSQQIPQETSQQTSEQNPQQTSQQTLQQRPEQMPQQTTQQTLQQMSQQTPEKNSQQTLHSQQTLQHTPEQTPQQTSQQTPQRTSQQTPQQSTQETLQQTPEQTPQKTPQQTPQKTPQQTPQQTQGSSDIEEPVAMETEPIPVKEKVRRGPKRKRDKGNNPLLGNRRSTRVRNTAVKKKEDSINYQELLRQFLPSSLQDSGDCEEIEGSHGSSERSNVTKKKDSRNNDISDATKQPASPVSDPQEWENVWQFLAKRQRNSGIVQVLRDYLIEVASKLCRKWPSGLSSVFVEGFIRSRPHIILPSIFSSEYTGDFKVSYGLMLLSFAELKVDQLVSVRNKTPNSSSKKADVVAMGQHFESDMFYVQWLTTSGVIQEDQWLNFTARFYWMKARFMMLIGNSDQAIQSFSLCTDILSDASQPDHEVFLPNCIMDSNRITIDLVKEQLKSTQHCQSLEEIQRLYEAEQYDKVTELLLPTLQDTSSRRKMLKEGATPQRTSQLLLLHHSLLKLNDYKQCVMCGAASISESLQEITVAKTSPIREEWITLAMQLFTVINKALSEDIDCLKQLDRPQRVRFTNAIIGVIELCMDSDWNLQNTSVLPWVVLYQVIKHEEDQIASKEISVTLETQGGSGRSSTPMIPSSLMLLDTAHEYLGRRSLCCNSDGAFLRLNISVLSREISMGTEDEPHPFLSDLQYSLEQCFYCLHGHPSKKTKARHLQDHGVDELPMDLEDARIIFNYFKPSVLPEFDSYKTSSMSADLESLLLKIVRIIPVLDNPAITIETLQSYMEEKTEEAPSIPKDRPITRPVVKEIYYLLADFYFKNKEFFKAIKFYMQDLCVCPDRLDSWAGMALARSGRLECKLCDAKTEGTIYKQSVAALRCFHRALEIDKTNRSLWIEYGSMSYMLHSHASRQLKQKEQFSLTDDIVKFLQEKRTDCLSLAESCFQEAIRCEVDGEEEEWLVHYMLGKIAEKRQKDPEEFLEHYKKAAYYLHEDEAKYPKKIAYHNPPDLSLEALEMFFRLHASILKLLEKPDSSCEDNFAMFRRYILDAADEPFVIAQENTDTSEPQSSAENDPDSKSDVKGQEVKLYKQRVPGSPLFIATPTDHDYLKSRNKKRQSTDSEDQTAGNQSTPEKLKDAQNEDGLKTDAGQQSTPEKQESTQSETKDDHGLSKPKENTDLVKSPEGEKVDAQEGFKDDGIILSSQDNPEELLDKMELDENEKNQGQEKDEGVVLGSLEEQRIWLIERCLEAMKLCLTRFPQHYKSLYRMSNAYSIAPSHKNLQWSRDLLLGSVQPWQQTTHMPSPALFAEHWKTKNLFHGIWRIPISEIDRSGSFSWHMYRSVSLLIDILKKLQDHAMLLQISIKLNRTPELGKQFLRDGDRQYLAKYCYKTCQTVLQEYVTAAKNGTEEQKLQAVLSTYQLVQTENKLQTDLRIPTQLLTEAYKTYKDIKDDSDIPVLEQATRFCFQRLYTSKTPQTPPTSQPEPLFSPGP